MHGHIIHLDQTQRKTHVMEVTEQYVTTSFGTFRRQDEEWVWICDDRFKLKLPAGLTPKAFAHR